MISQKQVLSCEEKIHIEDNPVVISLSKYSNGLMIVINETGAIGSIVLYFL